MFAQPCLSENLGRLQYLYRKNPKILDTRKIAVMTLKLERYYYRVIGTKDADGMANSVYPDQTASLGAVWSGSALFAQPYLSENLGK